MRPDGDPASWIIGQPSEQVPAASAVLGAVLDHGPGESLPCLDGDQQEAADTGPAVHGAGPDAIRDAISSTRERAGIEAAQAGLPAMSGRLHDWPKTRSSLLGPGPIRSILRDQIIVHSAVDRRNAVLGEVVEVRRFHSLGSLALRTGTSGRRLFRLPQGRG